MYQKTWSHSQEALLSEKSKIWGNMYYMTMPFCKGNTGVPHVFGSMCVLCARLEAKPEIWQDISTTVTWVIWGEGRMQEEKGDRAKHERKSAFRKPHTITGFVHLYRIMYMGGHLHKEIHFKWMFKQRQNISPSEGGVVCNNNPDLSSDKLEEESSPDRIRISCQVSLNSWLL